jgi:hypothetical protein
MPSEIGPYDGRRARRKRCDACVKRRIRVGSTFSVTYDRANAVKCRDGIPCENCRRTGRSCTAPIKQAPSMPVFVGWKSSPDIKNKEFALLLGKKSSLSVPQSMTPIDHDCTIPYFFTCFLPMNLLVNDKSASIGLLAMAKSSPALRDAIQAVAELHRKQQDQFAVAGLNAHGATYKALQAYDRSVRCMQVHIMTNTFLDDPSALWTTFLLGLFEVRIVANYPKISMD